MDKNIIKDRIRVLSYRGNIANELVYPEHRIINFINLKTKQQLWKLHRILL